MKALNKLLLIFLCLTFFSRLQATHNRAGEITYTRIAPTTTVIAGFTVEVFKYRITLVKYTDHGSNIADRCVDTVLFGDGTRGIALRTNGTSYSCGCNIGTTQIPCGQIIINSQGYTVKKNVYVIEHTYPGPGNFLIRSYDPNRNGDVINIKNSINQPFYLESLLIINSFTGANTAPVFNNAPIDRGCLNQCFEHNPAAYDVDGDSLSYEITTSRGFGGQTVSGYSYPSAWGGTYSIDAVIGKLSWCSPNTEGEYNIAFIVKEWRKNTNRVYQLIGYVLRDMQVIIGRCPDEFPPQIDPLTDTCVEAGTIIKRIIHVSDANNTETLTLQGAGGAFSANAPVATLSNTIAVTQGLTSPGLLSNFFWQTDCSHIREQPYYTTFKAQDNGSVVKQVYFTTFGIKVVPPAVKNVTAVPLGTTMRISWSLSTCSPTNNPLVSYKIYRKNSCAPFVFQPCTSEIPVSSGYVLVGQTNTITNFYIDNNGGNGLVVGQNYSYLVIAVYTDGTKTFSSAQVCSKLKRDVPVILNVDVLTTSATTGSVKIKWQHPITNAENLDTTVYTGPYTYKLKRKNSSGNYDVIFTSTGLTIQSLATQYTDLNINTESTSQEYAVEFSSGADVIGTSQKASSVYLNLTPSDRRIDLKWNFNTPWSNYKYTISRKNPGTNTYTVIATTSLQSYTDNDNIANRNNYCYYVTSEGAYSDPGIPSPLINNSQEKCAFVVDLTPPCAPTLAIEADCPAGEVYVSWQDVRKICDRSDDVTKYNLFYKPTVNDEFTLVATLSNTSSLEYVSKGQSLISGCYAIQAVDSANNKGEWSANFCVDNCPIFELPNVFTPNNDNVNDFFQAVRVRHIKSIDLNIYDRWGNLVYKTTDPYFKWDGNSIMSKQPVSEGTLFYICDVYEPRLRGIIKHTLKGYAQLVR